MTAEHGVPLRKGSGNRIVLATRPILKKILRPTKLSDDRQVYIFYRFNFAFSVDSFFADLEHGATMPRGPHFAVAAWSLSEGMANSDSGH